MAVDSTGAQVGKSSVELGGYQPELKRREAGQWVTGTPKSKRSRRTVALPSWLAQRMVTYLGRSSAPQRPGPRS